jgi:hypothetical protein
MFKSRSSGLSKLAEVTLDATSMPFATCDPIARLPLEISSYIFIRCLPDYRPDSDAPCSFSIFATSGSISRFPLRLYIQSIFPNAANLEIWLGRARGLPFSLSLHRSLYAEIGSVVKQHASRVRILSLGVDRPG